MALVLMQTVFITILLSDAGYCRLILRYIDQKETWKKAFDHCKSLNGTLFSPTTDELNSLNLCDNYNNISYPIWTGRVKSLSAWIEIKDCFKKEDIHFNRTVTYDEDNITEYDCQQYCSGDSSFAQGLSGECLCNVTTNTTESTATCSPEYPYRVYNIFDNSTITYQGNDYEARTFCIHTICNGQCSGIKFRRFLATDCCSLRQVKCKNSAIQVQPSSWYDAKSFCNETKSVLYDNVTLSSSVTDSWIGISRGYAYINTENVQNPNPLECVTYFKTSLNISRCDIERTFLCKIDIDNENEMSGDCNVTAMKTTSESTSTNNYISSTEYSSTKTTDYNVISTSSLSEIQTTAISSPTENQTKSTSISTKILTTSLAKCSTENKTSPVVFSTENQTPSTSYLTERQTTPTSYSTETQTISTSFSNENVTVTTVLKPLSRHKQSEQFPTLIVGSAIGVVVIVLIIIVAVLVMVRRKKIPSNKYRKHDKVKGTEKPTVNDTKGSPGPVDGSNVSGAVYCDPWQSFEESQTLTNAGKKLNRQSQNPMYEMNSLQYDSYSVAGGLTKQSHTEKYENVNLDIYNHCNVGDSKMAVSQQNVYDSAAGIYSHLNHGGIEDHNEDTYDHFHGSDQDYDQFDRTLRNTEESEYSIYQ